MGGSWQVSINGFAGVKIQKGILSVNPKMPRIWRKILFSLHWRRTLLRLEVKSDKVKIRLVSPGRKKVKIRVFGVLYRLAGDKTFEFERKRPAKKPEAYYL
jgi:trehalose/maltose hydrolase-like predicted phosphorylase